MGLMYLDNVRKNEREEEPLVGLNVSDIILVTELSWCKTLFESLSLCRGPVLVSTADVERSAIPGPYVARVRIGTIYFGGRSYDYSC